MDSLTDPLAVAIEAAHREMFEHEPVSSVNPSASKADQLRNIREIYPPEREALGVVAIGIELLDP